MSTFIDPSIARAMGEFDRYALELAAYIGAHPHPNPLRYRIFSLTQVEDDDLLDALTTKVRQLLELRAKCDGPTDQGTILPDGEPAKQ